MFSIKGKVALVTGGASGIGLATVKKLLENDARGVAIADVNDEAGEAALESLRNEFSHEKIIYIRTDVSNKKSFEDAFKFTLAAFNNIDILVNNAGILDDINYEKEIATNFTGTTHGIILGMNKYISNYKTGSEGVIINTASIAGIRNLPCVPIYGATKNGIVTLTTTLGHKLQYNKTKVKILAIAPGGTMTNIMSDFEKGMLNETCKKMALQDLEHLITQTSDFVGEKIIEIIQTKPTGTVWAVEDGKEPVEFTRPGLPYEYV